MRGLLTLVDDERTGLLVDSRDPRAYADAVRRIIDNPAFAEALGEQAARKARGFTWSTTAARLRRLYADLTSNALVECGAGGRGA